MSRALCFIFLFILSTIGCATLEPAAGPQLTLEPFSQVYKSSYEETWRSLQKSLLSYPIAVNNIDNGQIKTDIVEHGQSWDSPVAIKRKTRATYKLEIQVVKGTSSGNDSTKIVVQKNISINRDFFSNQERLPSDGFEEKALLYRVARELQIEKSLKKAFEQNKL